MCTTCGCASSSDKNDSTNDLDTVDLNTVNLNTVNAHLQASQTEESRRIEVEQNILTKNNRYAEHNRVLLSADCVSAFNLLSSPGSGKTTLLSRTVQDLKDSVSIAVIEGDQQTDFDAERIRALGVEAVQINTGKGCHLDAQRVGHALEQLHLGLTHLLFIENVGNLVCPAAFDLGEKSKITVLSVTEGEDKPLKYPDMFHASQLMLINKIDLLPYVDFNPEKTIEYARRINPNIECIQVSAKTGEGLIQWYGWLQRNCPELKTLPMEIRAVADSQTGQPRPVQESKVQCNTDG